MSVAALEWAMQQKAPRKAVKAVLIVLEHRYNDTKGYCYPGVNRIAQDAGIDRTTVMTAIEKLSQLGLLDVEKRGGSGHGRQTNIYRFPTFKSGEAKSGNPTLHTGGQSRKSRGAKSDSQEAKSGNPTQKGSKNIKKEQKESASRRFPALWEPNDETRAWIRNRGYPDSRVERVLKKIKAHKFPTPVTDFDARFRSWLENERPLPDDVPIRPSAAEQLRQLGAEHGLIQYDDEPEDIFRARVLEADLKERYPSMRT